ncbi:MAG: hypothetical protein HQL69_07020 [Magnetococcales bacterium]|nr:hypothetical protein [Magnetococcales bacterium]
MSKPSSELQNAKIVQELIDKAVALYEQSDFASSLQILESVIKKTPNDAELHYLCGLTSRALNLNDRCIEHSSKAVQLQPDNHNYLNLLADALIGSDQVELAKKLYLKSIQAKPDLLESYLKLYKTYLCEQQFNEAINLLNSGLQHNPDNPKLYAGISEIFKGMNLYTLENYYTTLTNHFSPEFKTAKEQTVQNTFFIDPQKAISTANKQNRIAYSKAAFRPQLCYFLGKNPNIELPINLIQVDPDSLIDFFTTTIFDLKIDIDFDPNSPEEKEQAYQIAAALGQANAKRKQLIDLYKDKCQKQKPVFIANKPMRVMIASSKLTTVMQYNSRDLAKGFRKNGCDVLFLIEEDVRELLGQFQFCKKQSEFVPHIIVHINHLNNNHIHPDTFNVSWWQDTMPQIVEGRQIMWRKRDLVFSIDKNLDQFLQQCGAKKVLRQGFCYDEDIFNNKHVKRKNKVVIIASSYRDFTTDTPKAKKLVDELTAHFCAGKSMTDQHLMQFSQSSGFTKDKILFRFWSYVVRDKSVEWLCELSDKIEVEVYGRYWDKNPIVAPFYKGELPHGPAVADVYNSAKYTLSPHPFDLGSQRLVEASACGTIPIVYDCRKPSQDIKWQKSCLWYKSKKEMEQCFTKVPSDSVDKICAEKSYSNFAKSVLDIIDKQLSEDSS